MKKELSRVDLAKYNSGIKYRKAFSHHVILDLVRNDETETFIARKHGIPPGSLNNFKQGLLEKLGYMRILQRMKDQQNEKDQPEDLAKQNEDLKKALELALLKVEALEVLVDVAEDQFNIDIRKKVGSKQSK